MNKTYYLFCFGEHFVDGKKVFLLTRLNDVEPISKEQIEEYIKEATDPSKLDDYFNHCDYSMYVDKVDGVEDYLKGVLFTDAMGQQCLEILPLNEMDMEKAIIDEFEKSAVNDYLDLGDESKINSTTWDEFSSGTMYKPLGIRKRVDEDGEVQYDVECSATSTDGVEIPYVENLDCVGFFILFNTFITVTRK